MRIADSGTQAWSHPAAAMESSERRQAEMLMPANRERKEYVCDKASIRNCVLSAISARKTRRNEVNNMLSPVSIV